MLRAIALALRARLHGTRWPRDFLLIVHPPLLCGINIPEESTAKWKGNLKLDESPSQIRNPKLRNWTAGAGMVGKCCFVLAVTLAFAQVGAAQYNQGDVELGFTLYNANCITCHGPNG